MSKINDSTLKFQVGDVNFSMVYVEGGTFKMGAQEENHTAPNYDDEATDCESPVHDVILSSYYIGETTVTQALWKSVMGTTVKHQQGKAFIPRPLCGENDECPMYYVFYEDVISFIKKLNNKTNYTFRLPTEAEWEFAARGGNRSCGYKYSGSNNIDDVAWYDKNSNKTVHPVKCKNANELGLYDMSGNVWELCSDWYGRYDSEEQTNPLGPNHGPFRVWRGGSFFNWEWNCRVSHRHGTHSRRSNCGFRLVLPVFAS